MTPPLAGTTWMHVPRDARRTPIPRLAAPGAREARSAIKKSASSALGGRSLPACNVQRHRRADERLQGRRVDLLALVDVDGSSRVPIEAGVEEAGGVLQGGALGERHLHDVLVCLAGADDPVVRPDRGPHPLPLLEDVGVCLLDQSADPAERLAAPVAELGDSLADQLRRRLAFLPGPGAFHRRLVGMIRIYHYRHQRKLGVPLSAYPTALLRVVLSCWEAVAETALLPRSFQMVAEGGSSEAVDRHRMAVPDDAVADLLPDSGRDASASLRLRRAWRDRRAWGEGEPEQRRPPQGRDSGSLTAIAVGGVSSTVARTRRCRASTARRRPSSPLVVSLTIRPSETKAGRQQLR